MASTVVSKQDSPTVTPDGKSLAPMIHGVSLKRTVIHTDSRGELGEIYDPRWGLIDAPLVYVYYSIIRPRAVKGWVFHKLQTDRFFVISGFLKIVLYDPRVGSPTKGMISEFYLTERDRGILLIPPLVVHAVENVGETDCVQINMPTVAYNHANPDKYRVPLDEIPYEFGKRQG